MNSVSRLPFSRMNPLTRISASTSCCKSSASSRRSPLKLTIISSSFTEMVCTQGWLLRMATARSRLSSTEMINGLEVFTFESSQSMLPCMTIFPWSMSPMPVHCSDSSESTWELTRIVLPRSHSSFKISLNSTRLLGSSPEVGSSRTRSFGSWISARARQRRCFIPLERPST